MSYNPNRVSTKSPTPRRRISSIEELLENLRELLATFKIANASTFPVIVEGTTDVAYLKRAVELSIAEYQYDPLKLPLHLQTSKSKEITICTPRSADDERRGGIPQIVRLAKQLHPYVFWEEVIQGIIIVFDHDTAGLDAADKLESDGYNKTRNILTLDPREHPDAMGAKQVVIEDLLSADIQRQFFAIGSAWCDCVYQDGELVRYRWHYKSKAALCSFVCENGTYEDFGEIHHLLRRIRSTFGFP